MRGGVGPGSQPLFQEAGRRRDRGPTGSDPAGGAAVLLSSPGCESKTFAEQFDGLTTRYAQDAAAGRDVRAHRGRAGHALELHEEAHRLCFTARSVNFPVSCEPVIT
jgi:hypothetical protein